MKGIPSGIVTARRLPALSRAASGFVVGLGTVVLLGWILGLPPLIRLLPIMVAMNPVTALTFVMMGVSLWRLGRQSPGPATANGTPSPPDRLGLVLGGLVALVGALKLADYLFGLGFHIDHLLFPGRIAPTASYPPSEMAPNTALAFLLCGLGLLMLDVEIPHGFRPAQLLILSVGFIALLALIGYTYRVLLFYRVGMAEPMSLDSAIGFAAFCLGFLAARPRAGVMSIITSPTTGGAVARRLLPMAILIPWVLGAALLLGEMGRFYEREFALSFFAVASIVAFTVLIWWNAKLLYLADLERERAQRRLVAQHNSTRVLAEASTLNSTLPKILRVIGETLGWQFGALWRVDDAAQAIRCVETWEALPEDLAAFSAASRGLALPKGKGFPGRVWESARPVWVEDLTSHDELLGRAPALTQTRLRSGFGLPIRLGPEVFGVMEFFTEKREPVDESLLEMLSSVGSQVGLFIERMRAEEQLRQTTANLARSNTDLQQFAYVASHDLFEPLRMVTSYLQLLRERSEANLDPQAREFLGFALDGANRMAALIQDLLAYSRLELRGRPLEPTDCEKVFQAARANLKVAIEESGAAVMHTSLPTVRADAVQLTQVFQNLIGNALKFRGNEAPRIEVEAHPGAECKEWVFSVRDNGIGIEPRHFERIFVIFQRLHTRQEYAGTGMGLAICKKIIERHGGKIWVESHPGKGATFFFTLPAMA
jgi:signal transduction histidine kinase